MLLSTVFFEIPTTTWHQVSKNKSCNNPKLEAIINLLHNMAARLGPQHDV